MVLLTRGDEEGIFEEVTCHLRTEDTDQRKAREGFQGMRAACYVALGGNTVGKNPGDKIREEAGVNRKGLVNPG